MAVRVWCQRDSWQRRGLSHYYRVPGEFKRREVELDPQPRRDHEQGGGAVLRKLDFSRFGLFLNSCATDIVLVTLPKHGS